MPHLVPLSPALLVAAAFVGVSEEGGDNRGQIIEHFLRSVALSPGQPWCAAVVHRVGHSAHFDHVSGRSSWPLPATGSCEALARAASRFGVLDEDGVHERDVHRCVTIEGNTNSDGGSNGHSTLRKVRTFREVDGHRFIRWPEIVRLAVAA